LRADTRLFRTLGDQRFGWVAYAVALAIGLIAGAIAILLVASLS
jgi:hypothetical protein